MQIKGGVLGKIECFPRLLSGGRVLAAVVVFGFGAFGPFDERSSPRNPVGLGRVALALRFSSVGVIQHARDRLFKELSTLEIFLIIV